MQDQINKYFVPLPNLSRNLSTPLLVLSAGSGPSSPQTSAFLKLSHLGLSLGLGVASFCQMKTKKMFHLWTIMFLIIRLPCHHNIIQNNWNQDSFIHHDEQETKMISLQAHNLKHRKPSTHMCFFLHEWKHLQT
jgi:hypothetical protein